MYFIDRTKIEKTLTHIDRHLLLYEEITLDHDLEKLSMERIIHVVIESILDVGQMMIDGFIMRDPGSYEDIIDILIDEKVLPKEGEEAYKQIIQLRPMIVKNYLVIDHGQLDEQFIQSKKEIAQFSSHVRSYLNNEMGVAHAFSNK